ncbi:MAG: nucleotidyltransferase domain-containing protein [Thermoguttaceae bacterium]|nr:nucleotidyltransferase domain-containing protein [Thermoguttaceae bacterium]
MDILSDSAAKYGLRDAVIAELRRLAESSGIGRLWLFGSRARGDYRDRSDIDLAAEGGRVNEFAQEIEEKVPTLLMFDVVDLSRPVAEELRRTIEREGILLYEKV